VPRPPTKARLCDPQSSTKAKPRDPSRTNRVPTNGGDERPSRTTAIQREPLAGVAGARGAARTDTTPGARAAPGTVAALQFTLCPSSGTKIDPARSSAAVLLTPNVLSVKHWDRLLGGLLYAASCRVDWASLVRRSFEIDVLKCASCGGRLRMLGEVTDPRVVGLVLESLQMSTEAPPVGHARDPTELLGEAAEE
jgi:hypothetical protein